MSDISMVFPHLRFGFVNAVIMQLIKGILHDGLQKNSLNTEDVLQQLDRKVTK